MAQVKFYSVASLPETPDAGGVYFVNNGELYKGAQRFGLGRVTVANSTTDITDAARGDIVVTGSGAGWVYVGSGEGEGWKSIGGDVSDIRALVSSMTSGLSKGDSGSYITHIEQDANGNVTANAVAFPTLTTGDADGQVKLNGVNATVSGWSAVKTDISNLQSVVSYSGTGTKAVTADTGTFTNLTVTDTATFSVTNVSASSLTVNGSTIEEIADARIAAISSVTQTGASNGITVSVTTSAGSVTAVSVDATAFGNVMSFKGVVTALPSEANQGDIVVIGANPETGLVQGQEYICTASSTTEPAAEATWELIGDQNTYAVNAYSSSAAVYTGATTLPAAVGAAGAAIDDLTSRVSTLEGAVIGGSDDDGSAGVNVSVTTAATTAAPSVTVTVTKATLNATLGTSNVADKTVATSIGATGADTALATEKAVRDAITAAELVWLDASGAVIS